MQLSLQRIICTLHDPSLLVIYHWDILWTLSNIHTLLPAIRGMQAMKKKIIVVLAAIVIVFVGVLSARYIRSAVISHNDSKPSEVFIATINTLYEDDSDIAVSDTSDNNKDVTEEFKNKHLADYQNKDYKAIWNDVRDRYSFSGTDLPGKNS